MSARAIYLGGDSYPTDQPVEQALTQRLAPAFAHWTGQQALIARDGGRYDTSLDARLAGLAAAADASAAHAPALVLLGRSSGARVATLHARTHPVQAVVCLGYPFRAPDGPDEPERWRHLAALAVPTLIVQGTLDVYGRGDRCERDYPLSPSVRVQPVRAKHTYRFDAAQWDALAATILDFLREAARRPGTAASTSTATTRGVRA